MLKAVLLPFSIRDNISYVKLFLYNRPGRRYQHLYERRPGLRLF